MAMVIKIRVPRWVERAVLRPMEVYHSIRLGSDVRLIPLTKGKFAIVDRAKYEELNNKKWYVQKGDGLYAIHRHKGKTIWMHRMLMNAPREKKVDHRNNDGLDNRKENLRLATNSENNKNRRKMKGKFTSKYKGAFWDKRRKCWVARIYVNGKLIHIGSFKNEIEAAKAYDAAARKYHGEFAKLNFPERSEAQSASDGVPLCGALCEALSFGLHKSAGGCFLRLANWLGTQLNFPKEKA